MTINFDITDKDGSGDELIAKTDNIEIINYCRIEGFRDILKLSKKQEVPISKTLEFLRRLDGIQSSIDSIIVESDDTQKQIETIQATVDSYRKEAEKERVELKEPFLLTGKKIDSFFKKVKDKATFLNDLIIDQKESWLLRKEEERKKAEAEAREKARKIQQELEDARKKEQERVRKEAEEKARKKGIEDAKAKELAEKEAEAVPVVPEVVTAVPPEVKGLKTVEKWRIIDFRALSEKCLEARGEKIKDAIAPWVNAQAKAGIKDIPGIEFYTETKIK